ncbi:ATP-grasp domain-containing protein [Rhodopila sp.]|uniref:ATP-grasp domain-containing protein n=1 Tax=Rhodopila sp. TaxID=2480087 RepID=UPI003D0EB810
MRDLPAHFTADFTARGFAPGVIAPVADHAASDGKLTGAPHILLATTGQLPSTARLAIELHDAGAQVSLIGPSNHPAKTLSLVSDRLIYRAMAPRFSLERALLRLRPDIVIPCDERTVRDLHAIWRDTRHPSVKRLIERSTAPGENFATITSRAALLAVAERHGVRVPTSMPLHTIGDLDRWTAGYAAPFVLKADGSWAGFGVRIISDGSAAKDAFRQMTRRSSGRLAVRESLLEGNHFGIRSWLRRERPAMSAQSYVDGWPANIGVACWQGQVLAAVCAESVATSSATGPSTVARIIHNTEMIDAAKRVVRALGLSGMIGFDFMIEAATGAAYLIEMNPRNTPICALRLGAGRDLAEAMVAVLAARPVRERPPCTNKDIVVFFPDTWREDPANHLMNTEYHDVPWQHRELVRLLMMPERRERYWVMRRLRRVWLKMNGSSNNGH